MSQSWVLRGTRYEDEGHGEFGSQARLQQQLAQGKKEQDMAVMITIGRGRQGAI